MAVTRLLTATADATALRTALDTASGYPHRARVVGCPDALPLEYSAGAPGWTAVSGARITSLGDGYSTLEVSEYAQQFMGTTVGDVEIPAFGQQRAVMLAGQSNARDAVVPSVSADGHLFLRVAQGGTGLAAGWEIGGTLFNQTVSACYGFDVEFWWIQGERDANDAEWSAAYAANFSALMAAFRARFSIRRAHIALLNSACQYPHTAIVRQAQIDYCAADPANNVAFDMDAFAEFYDGLHYDGTGNAAIGTALAATLG